MSRSSIFHNCLRAVVLLAVIAFTTTTAKAQNTFLPTGEGDWFDASLWRLGEAPIYDPDAGSSQSAPLASRGVRIDDGGTAVASSVSPLHDGLDLVGTLLLIVGSQPSLISEFPNRPSGTLRVEGLDLVATQALVGAYGSPFPVVIPDEFSSVGKVSVDQDFRVSEALGIGFSRSTNGKAAGHVSVGGDLVREGRSAVNFIQVGESSTHFESPPEQAPRTEGILEVSGSIIDFADLRIATGAFETFRSGTTFPAATGGISTARVDVSGDVLTSAGGFTTPSAFGDRIYPVRTGTFSAASGTGTLDADVQIGGDLHAITSIAYSDQERSTARVEIGGDLIGGLRAARATRGGHAIADVVVAGRMEIETDVTLARAGAGSTARATVSSGSVVYAPIDEPSGSSPSPFVIAEAFGGGIAQAHLTVRGDFLDFEEVIIGAGLGDGEADGTLELSDGLLRVGSLSIAPEADLGANGTALGRVLLDGSRAEIDSLEIGSGGTLEIRLDGDASGLGPIVATSTSFLAGTLHLVLDGPSSPRTIDILLAQGSHGIVGEFESVLVAGLDPAAVRIAQEVVQQPDGSSFEILRAYVVPEPTTSTLILLGLMLLSRPSRRSLR